MRIFKVAAPIGFVPVSDNKLIHIVRRRETFKSIIRSRFPQLHFTRSELTEVANTLAMLNGYGANQKAKPGEVLNLLTAIDVRLVLDNMYTPQPADRTKPKN